MMYVCIDDEKSGIKVRYENKMEFYKYKIMATY